MEQEKPIKLKRCPFCGSDDLDLDYRHTNRYEDDDCVIYFVICWNCDCYGPSGSTKASAIEQWNNQLLWVLK